MLLHHQGHSCLVVEAAGSRVLIDPGAFSTQWHTTTGLDAICVTHVHVDHCDQDNLQALLDANPGAPLLAEPMIAEQLGEAGFTPTVFEAGQVQQVGGLRVEGVGGRHAVIHADIPRVGNVGMVFTADGEPTLFHPGDALEYVPDGVDVLAVPLNAPWCAFKETVEFTRSVAPGVAVPIHDALLSPTGRRIYLTQLEAQGHATVRDLRDREPVVIDP